MSPNAKMCNCFELWSFADKNEDGELSVKEVQRLFDRLNLEMSKKKVKLLLKEFTDGRKYVTKQEFEAFVKKMFLNPELKALYKLVSQPDSIMSSSKFSKFLHGVQLHAISEVDDIVSKYEDDSKVSLDAFLEYFNDPDAAIVAPVHQREYMDMSRPLGEYFIKSSHNTYLTGDQLQSDSSVDSYVNALKLGCRCVEIDCWDGPDGQPIVYHGYTLTSKVLFEDVIKGIKKHAFDVTPYPLLLSLEVHCGLDQQKTMASIMKKIIGDALVTEPLKDDGSMPSPEELRYRIFVKGKVPAKAEESGADDESDESDEDRAPEGKKNHPKPKVARELGDLAMYMKSKKFKGFDQAFKEHLNCNVSSFSEKKADELVKQNYDHFVKFNILAFSRLYPKGTRLDSSNINPLKYWQAGGQIAALNYQEYDKGQQLNLGFFDHNGGAGYVLKPPFLRNVGKREDTNLNLKVTVISATQLPKATSSTEHSIANLRKGDVIDPYVEVELFVPTFGKGDELVDEEDYSTSVVDDNGFNPSWTKLSEFGSVNECPHVTPVKNKTMEFKTQIKCPELSILRFLVEDQDFGRDDFIAVGVIPLNIARQGYRRIKLRGKDQKFLPRSSLLVHISLK